MFMKATLQPNSARHVGADRGLGLGGSPQNRGERDTAGFPWSHAANARWPRRGLARNCPGMSAIPAQRAVKRHPAPLKQVQVAAMAPERFVEVLDEAAYARMAAMIERAQPVLRGRVVWN